MLIASTYAIFTSSLFIFSSSSLYFRLDAGRMETREQFTFPLPENPFIPRQPILENVVVNFVVGITNLVGNSPFLLIVVWSLGSIFGDRIARVSSDCLTKFSSWTDNSIFNYQPREECIIQICCKLKKNLTTFILFSKWDSLF